MNLRIFLSSFSIVTLLAASACSPTPTRESTGEYVDSAVISTKVRAKLAADDPLSIFPIDVTTFRDVVQLSGFVSTAKEKRRAEEIAASVDGVREVKNDLVVKKSVN